MARTMGVVWAALMLAALWMSLKTVMNGCGVDPDSIMALTLWQGITAHGLGWVSGFSFTPDNWLFSIMPVDFLGFVLFGARAWVVVASGWLVLALSALAAGWLAARLGAGRAAYAVPLLLLLVGWYAQDPGYVAYPTSHDVTNLLGILALLCLCRLIQGGGRGWLAGLGLLLFMGTLADPWMMAAYDVPVLLVVGWEVWRGARLGAVVLVVLGVMLLVRAHRHLGLWFLPPGPSRPAHPALMLANLSWLPRDLGGLLAVIPLPGSQTIFWAPALAALVVAGLVLWAVWPGLRTRGDEASLALVMRIAVLSGGLTAMGFVGLNIVQGPYAGRFLLNDLYLFAVLLAVGAGRVRGLWRRVVVGLYAAAFMLCGLITTHPAWGPPGIQMQTNGLAAEAAFLEANGLSYGYGPYHGSGSNAVTALSGGEVVIRPVLFDAKTGWILPTQRAMTARDWVTPADVPPGTASMFVFIVDDGETCPNPAVCVAGVSAQFGPPARRLSYRNAVILVWDHRVRIAPP